MNTTHLHLFLNHAPLFALLFGLYFLAMGLWKRSISMRLSAITLFTIAALTAVPVFLSGEPAEESVEGLPDVSKFMLEDHEESAGVSFYAVILLGGLSVTAIYVYSRRRALPSALFTSICVMALVCTASVARTAYLGGQIRHSEIRSDAPPAQPGLKEQDD